MEGAQVLRSLQALDGADDDTVDGFLMAAVYLRALHSGDTPRDILDALWKAMPSADAWPALRDSLAVLLDD